MRKQPDAGLHRELQMVHSLAFRGVIQIDCSSRDAGDLF